VQELKKNKIVQVGISYCYRYINYGKSMNSGYQTLPEDFTGTVEGRNTTAGIDWIGHYLCGTIHNDLGPAYVESTGREYYYLHGEPVGKRTFWVQTWELNKDDPEKAKIIMANILSKK
jgi:hypothetical protein